MSGSAFNKIAVVFLAAFISIFGCGGSKTPVKSKVAKEKAEEKAEAEESPEPTTSVIEARFRFHPEGKRDPFVPFIAQELEGDDKLRSPLERFDLYQLKLTGVIAGMQAMVQAPDGMVYYIKVGTPIGRYGGKVVEIKRDHIVVKEKFRDYRGDVKFREVTLGFPEKRQ